MKKKIVKVLILIAILILAFLIIKSTYSKYTNSALGIINEKAGAWIIKVNGIDIADAGGTFDIDNFRLDENNAVNSHINGEQMAPGTKGRFFIELDPTGTDVSVKYTITIDRNKFITSIMEAIGYDPNDDTAREKIGLKITDVKINDTQIALPSDPKNDIVVSKIKRLNSIKSAEVTDRIDTLEVEVEWEDVEANNTTDYLIGNILQDYKLTLPITVNAIQWYELLKFSNFDKITPEYCQNFTPFGSATYETIYAGNNNQLEMDANGSLVLDEDNPILYYEVADGSKMFAEEYSVQFTIKGDAFQGDTYGNTIFSIGNPDQASYLSWLSIYQGYLHVYSYRDWASNANCNYPMTEQGFLSYDISSYSNQICNIQVVATRTGSTRVFINGNEIAKFESGGAEINCTQATIGDLRPLRNLKYVGTIYDFAMYDRLLTEDEIKANWLDAQERWLSE